MRLGIFSQIYWTCAVYFEEHCYIPVFDPVLFSSSLSLWTSPSSGFEHQIGEPSKWLPSCMAISSVRDLPFFPPPPASLQPLWSSSRKLASTSHPLGHSVWGSLRGQHSWRSTFPDPLLPSCFSACTPQHPPESPFPPSVCSHTGRRGHMHVPICTSPPPPSWQWETGCSHVARLLHSKKVH